MQHMFMFERILERLAVSPYAQNFILKGGPLISSMIGVGARTTMDTDTTVRGIQLEGEPGIFMICMSSIESVRTKSSRIS